MPRRDGPRILLIRLGALGDVANVAPAARALRDHFPQAYIAWLVEDRCQDAARLFADVDEVFVFERRAWQEGLWNPGRGLCVLPEAARLVSRLRAARFDVSLDFQGNLKSGVLGLLAGARERVGYAERYCRESNFIFTQHHYAPSQARRRRADQHLALLHHFGIDAAPAAPRARIPEDAAAEVRAFLGAGERPVVAMHPGASRFADFKRWPEEKFARLADRLIRERGCEVVFTRGPGEQELLARIQGLMRESARALPGEPSLAKLAALYRSCALVIAGDTGPLHLAAVLGAPVVGVYGPKDPILYAPAGERYTLVRAHLPCSPCRRRRCPGSACLRAVRVETVFEAASERLRNADRPAEVVSQPAGGAERCAGTGQPPYSATRRAGDGEWRFSIGEWRGAAAPAGARHELWVRMAQPAEKTTAASIVSLPGEEGEERVLMRYYAGAGARRAWRTAARLKEAGLPTPEPLARVERRRFVGRGESRYAAEAPAGAAWLEDALAPDAMTPAARGRLVDALARLAARFHQAGFVGAGAAPRAVLARPGEGGSFELWVCDVERVRRRGRARSAEQQDLRGWANALSECLSDREQARWLARYARERRWTRTQTRRLAPARADRRSR